MKINEKQMSKTTEKNQYNQKMFFEIKKLLSLQQDWSGRKKFKNTHYHIQNEKGDITTDSIAKENKELYVSLCQ